MQTEVDEPHRQQILLNGLRHLAGPEDGGGIDDHLARPLQDPLFPGNLGDDSQPNQTAEAQLFILVISNFSNNEGLPHKLQKRMLAVTNVTCKHESRFMTYASQKG